MQAETVTAILRKAILCYAKLFCRYFASIIASTRKTVAAVELLSDGSYRPMKAPVVGSVVIKDDEEETSDTDCMIKK